MKYLSMTIYSDILYWSDIIPVRDLVTKLDRFVDFDIFKN